MCPTFIKSTIDEAAIQKLPDDAVPDAVLESAQAMPEAVDIHTTMQGPANRNPLTHRHEPDDSDSDGNADAKCNDSVDSHHAATLPKDGEGLHSDGVDPHHADTFDEGGASTHSDGVIHIMPPHCVTVSSHQST